MKLLSLTFGIIAVFAFASAQACPGMNKVTDGLKTYTGDKITQSQSPVTPSVGKKLLVDVKKPVTSGAN